MSDIHPRTFHLGSCVIGRGDKLGHADGPGRRPWRWINTLYSLYKACF